MALPLRHMAFKAQRSRIDQRQTPGINALPRHKTEMAGRCSRGHKIPLNSIPYINILDFEFTFAVPPKV
ncbi:iron-containing alcohol dehydrogenase [Phaeobacter sp. HF9A]|uniref:iron-containing alcohol dehydrogenase n=1 Tax=Phaeobacter sp. HF9A TaxID=2721561 RepID=UPI001431A5E9|nr:iron-containing alcohol dehydrogenase [Phaeobacter sp. HF9A]NIZ13396.1 iron-containing alcohol dehydrogenase [Phaeobacter sp. HF9A]